MDQPTAEKALKEMEPLVGEWALEAIPPGGEPWRGKALAAIEWHPSGAHLVERVTIALPEAPDVIAVMGCDAANRSYYQLYSDDRGVCRVYEMSIGDGEWRLWRTGEPFSQRFTGRFEDDGNTIVGRWEKAEDGENYETDFDVIYRKVKDRSVPFTLRNLKEDLENIASVFDGAPGLEFRAGTNALELKKSALTYQHVPAGYRFPYGHTHKTQEEVYVVVRGSGRMKLDGEVVDLKEWDAVRVPPGTWRDYEAGPEGLEILVIGAPNLGDAPREDVDGQRDWWAK